jgi:hypothetical protein
MSAAVASDVLALFYLSISFLMVGVGDVCGLAVIFFSLTFEIADYLIDVCYCRKDYTL